MLPPLVFKVAPYLSVIVKNIAGLISLGLNSSITKHFGFVVLPPLMCVKLSLKVTNNISSGLCNYFAFNNALYVFPFPLSPVK